MLSRCCILLLWLLPCIFATEEAAGIHWSELSVSTDGAASTTILHPFSGMVENGHVCSVIGPSGAGKLSFLTALAGSSSFYVQGNV
jgi:ABC-type nitrate/sulfonate/bicarbonate transport system ATPase subunit